MGTLMFCSLLVLARSLHIPCCVLSLAADVLLSSRNGLAVPAPSNTWLSPGTGGRMAPAGISTYTMENKYDIQYISSNNSPLSIQVSGSDINPPVNYPAVSCTNFFNTVFLSHFYDRFVTF